MRNRIHTIPFINRKQYFLFSFFVCITSGVLWAQNTYSVAGNITAAKDKEIRLMGFSGTKDTLLSQTTANAEGGFALTYPKSFVGAALLQIKDGASLLLMTNHENFNISWQDVQDFNGVRFANSPENSAFQAAYLLNIVTQKKLAGLHYLLPLYANQPNHNQWVKKLENEIQWQSTQFGGYIQRLPKTSYAKHYLGYRKLLQDLQNENITTAQQTAAETAFLELDFSEKALYYSGLAKELFDEYLKQTFAVQEESFIVAKLNAFSDVLKKSSQPNTAALNNYTEYLVKQYEKFGLTACAEHLALSLLNDNKCIIFNQTLPILEQYKKMAIGNTAADIVFSAGARYHKLAEIPGKYKVVVFGASWCDACKTELPQLKNYVEPFKTNYDATIVFVSLDTDKESYNLFAKDFPFVSDCDFKSWEGENVKNYAVFATPSIFILNEKNSILAKPSTTIDAAKWLYQNVQDPSVQPNGFKSKITLGENRTSG